jgi:hypothetical protein
MFCAIAALVIALIGQWVMLVRGRGYFGVPLAIIATVFWQIYEWRLHSLAPVGDPLFRLDLIIFYPLLACVWVTAVGTSITQFARRQRHQSTA